MNRDRIGQFRQELETELKGNILPYWMKYTPDRVHGGFHGEVSHFNLPLANAPKGAILNTRILWTFAAAHRMYPKTAYLEMAQRAYHYVLDHFIDGVYGGVYWELDHKGQVSSSRKQIYALAFAIYAMAEYHMAKGDKDALETAIALYQQIEEHALDRINGGYTEALSREWKPLEDLRLSEKDDNESKTMNTHLHILEAYANLYRTWKDPRLECALEKLILLFLDRFVDPLTHHLNLFFDENWTLKSNLVSYGHDIECAWLLHEAAEVLGKPEMVEMTGKLSIKMARENSKGLDTDGGLFYEFFPSEIRLDSDKHWWPQAEAMVGYFNAYQLSGEEDFALKAMGSWEFIKKNLVDSKYGEWYWSVDREGRPQTAKEKAGFWKCPYHSGRACMEIVKRIDHLNR
jgi:mannobiose 2-epimerase